MLERTLVVGSVQMNCWLVACPVTGEGVIIDPGAEPDKIIRMVRGMKTPTGAPVTVKYLLHTHAHFDHIGDTRAVRDALVERPVIALHRDDDFLYKQLKMQGALFGTEFNDPVPVDHFLEDGEKIEVGKLTFTVIHTPGHSPGGVCFRLQANPEAEASETIYSGDTLFRGSIGRTDYWGGDMDLLLKSIRTRLLTLNDDVRVCPGHGPNTTIGFEKRQNPFLSR